MRVKVGSLGNLLSNEKFELFNNPKNPKTKNNFNKIFFNQVERRTIDKKTKKKEKKIGSDF